MDTELVERAKEVARRHGTYTASGIARELGIAWEVGHKIRCILEDDNAFNGELLVIRDRLEHEAERRSEDEKRQARWHNTRDAVLPAIVAEAVNHGMTAAECVHDAAMHADAAHGPLGAPNVKISNSDVSLSEAQLSGLVKAARRAGQLLTELMSQEMYGEHLMEGMEREDYDALNEARAALLVKAQPFEGVS